MSTTDWTQKKIVTAIALALALVTLLVYLPVIHHDFINYDDADYVITNSHVYSGLSWSNIVWAFGHAQADYWIPLTWISHMVDCQLFGLHPAGHHFVNVLFHAANTVLLFLLLNQITGTLWRSALVAALFAWHPLHVESVAWVAERKDVLSGLFWILTLFAYVSYVRHVTKDRWQMTGIASVAPPVIRHPSRFYVLSLFLFACGLMSKPMVVTLPFVLLLLDFWPLQRFSFSAFRFPVLFRLLVEKIPFLFLSVATSLCTAFTQKGAIWSGLPPGFRAANATISYLRYISKTFWPVDLSIIYPYPHYWPLGLVLIAGALLVVWTVLAIVRARQNPYLVTGWFWFLGGLVPVIGLLQSGLQSMADRFTYIPGIGFFIVVVWGVENLLAPVPHRKQIAGLLAAVVLGGCLTVTSLQLNYWENSITLFRHALAVTANNYLAEDCLGQTLERLGKNDDALVLYADAVRIEPDFPLGRFKLGMMLLEQGRADEASNHLAAAARLAPRDPVMQFDFGLFLAQHGKPDEASKYFKAALAARPDFPEAIQQLELIDNKTNSLPNHSTP